MNAYVVWMDGKEAKIFKLEPTETEKRRMKAHGHKHHTHAHGKHDTGNHHDDKFYGELAQSIKDATEILVMGPGDSKNHFKTYLTKHNANLAKAIVGIETVDHPTENQILEKARTFFKKYDLFHEAVT